MANWIDLTNDLQKQALLDEIDALESEIQRVRLRSKRVLASTLQYVAGFTVAGFLLFDGALVFASVALGLALPLVFSVLRRRKTKKLEQKRDQLIEAGTLVPLQLDDVL